MVQARNDLQQLKERNINNIPHIWLNKPNAYKVVSQFGIDSVYIDVPRVEKKEKAKYAIELKEKKPDIITYLTPAFEVFGNKDGVLTQLGYVINKPGGWGPPYRLIETDNVIEDWLDREEAAEVRAANPNITVDPFLWPNWVGYLGLEDDHPDEQVADKPFDGTLQDKEIYRGFPTTPGWDGETEVTLFEIACKFEEYYYIPYVWVDGVWRWEPYEVFNTYGIDVITEPSIYGHTYAECSGEEGKYYAGAQCCIYADLAAWRHEYYEEYMAIGNVKVPGSERPDDYVMDESLLKDSASSETFYFSTTKRTFAECQTWWADAPAVFEAKRAIAAAGYVPPPQSNAEDSYCVYGSTTLPSGLDNHKITPWMRCQSEHSGVWGDPWGYSPQTCSCKDTNTHVFWDWTRKWTDYTDYRQDKYYVAQEGILDTGDGPCDGSVDIETFLHKYVLSPSTTYDVDMYIVINNQWFVWAEIKDSSDGEALEKNITAILPDVSNRYYELDDTGDNFWVLMLTHNVHSDYSSINDVWPNRYLCWIYKSSEPGRLDMEPGDDSQCIEFDIRDQGAEVIFGKFEIPDVKSPDGGPVWCYGAYRLFRVTERTEGDERVERIEFET